MNIKRLSGSTSTGALSLELGASPAPLCHSTALETEARWNGIPPPMTLLRVPDADPNGAVTTMERYT
jgi:hypothetical protein